MEHSTLDPRNKINKITATDADGFPADLPIDIDGKPASLKRYFLYLSEDLLMS